MTEATVDEVREVLRLAKTNRVIRQLLELAIITHSATTSIDENIDYDTLDQHIANHIDEAVRLARKRRLDV